MTAYDRVFSLFSVDGGFVDGVDGKWKFNLGKVDCRSQFSIAAFGSHFGCFFFGYRFSHFPNSIRHLTVVRFLWFL